jgi:WD40 repeat protein
VLLPEECASPASHALARAVLAAYKIDHETGDLVLETHLRGSKRKEKQNTSVTHLECHPTNPLVLATTGADGSIITWKIGEPLGGRTELGSLVKNASRVTWCPDENALLASGNDGVVQLLDTREGGSPVLKFEARPTRVRDLAWCPHNSFTFASAWDDGIVQLCDVRRAKNSTVLSFPAHTGYALALAWHPKWAGVLATSGRDLRVRIWDTARYSGGGGHTVGSADLSHIEPLQIRTPGNTGQCVTVQRFYPSSAASSIQVDASVLASVDDMATGSLMEGAFGFPSLSVVPPKVDPLGGPYRSPVVGPVDNRTIAEHTTVTAPAMIGSISATDPVCSLSWRPGADLHLTSVSAGVDQSVSVWDISRPLVPVARFAAAEGTSLVSEARWLPIEPSHALLDKLSPHEKQPGPGGSFASVVLATFSKGGSLRLFPTFAAEQLIQDLPSAGVTMSVTDVASFVEHSDRSFWPPWHARLTQFDHPLGQSVQVFSSEPVQYHHKTPTETAAAAAAAARRQNNVFDRASSDLAPPEESTRVVSVYPDSVFLNGASTVANSRPAHTLTPQETIAALANGYRLEGGSRRELCMHNALVARKAGAREVAVLWEGLAAVCPLPRAAKATPVPVPLPHTGELPPQHMRSTTADSDSTALSASAALPPSAAAAVPMNKGWGGHSAMVPTQSSRATQLKPMSNAWKWPIDDVLASMGVGKRAKDSSSFDLSAEALAIELEEEDERTLKEEDTLVGADQARSYPWGAAVDEPSEPARAAHLPQSGKSLTAAHAALGLHSVPEASPVTHPVVRVSDTGHPVAPAASVAPASSVARSPPSSQPEPSPPPVLRAPRPSGISAEDLLQQEARRGLRILRHRLVQRTLKLAADSGDVQLGVSVVQVMGPRARAMVSSRRLERWVESYAELLHRLQLWGPASTILARSKIQSLQRVNMTSTTMHVLCARCSKDLPAPPQPPAAPPPRDPESSDEEAETPPPREEHPDFAFAGPQICHKCNKSPPLCALCQLPVTGLYVWCQGCGHGGHLDHMRDWFTTVSPLCPSGCGHSCDLRPLLHLDHSIA